MGKCTYSNAFRAFVFVLLSFPVMAQTSSSPSRKSHPATGEHMINVKKSGLDFVENKGQWNNEISYRTEFPGGVMFITNKGFVYNYASLTDLKALMDDDHDNDHFKAEKRKEMTVHMHAYRVNFVGANTNIKYSPEEKLSNYNNYFIGNDHSKWQGHVGLYKKIIQQNVYNGIDVSTYSHKDGLEYDFIVNAGANPDQIKLSFEGVTPVLAQDGSIQIKTSVNEIKELAPYCYQVINGAKTTVASQYKLEKGVLTFDFPQGYNKNEILVIDPVLVFATFSGSTGAGNGNYAYSSTYDDDGNMYASCGAYNLGWPTSLTAYQANFNGAQNSLASREVGINKYNATGTTLLYSTYFGGAGNDFPHAMKVNKQGELVLVGSTNSIDLPVTGGCYDNTLSGISDIFVTHFDQTGSTLLGSTYVGGSGVEPTAFLFPGTIGITENNAGTTSPVELEFDSTGNIWVVGNTTSNDFETAANNSQNTYTSKKWICQGSSIMFGPQTLTASGTYTETFATPSGCDSVMKLILTVGPLDTQTLAVNVCPGDTYNFAGQNLGTIGNYTHVFTSVGGCDSVVVLTLTVLPYKTKSLAINLCPGNTYSFGGTVLSTSGTYIDTFSTTTCDSIVTLNLTMLPYIQQTVSETICAGKSYSFGPQTLSTAGTYVDTFSTASCDSIVTLNLLVSPYVRDTVQASFCAGTSYHFGTHTLTAPGTYIDTLTSLSSCNKIITLQLSSGTVSRYKYYISICQGGSYTFGSKTLTTTGDYTDTFSTAGCDSIVTIHLEYRPNITNSVTAYMCPNSTYHFGTQTLTTAGTYTQSFATAACDSIVTLTLNYNPVYNDTIPVSICQGNSYLFDTTTILTAGTYTHTFASSLGCDSTVTIELGYLPYIANYISDSMCFGGTYAFDTLTLTDTGTYIAIYPTSGCDSVVTLTLSIIPRDTFNYTENYCSGSSYHFGDTTVSVTGVYYHTFQAISGCDSVVRLSLTGPWHNSDTLSGGIDVIIFKLDTTCSNLLYGGYLGGTGDESPTGLILNNAGNLVISGITTSADFPTTDGTMHSTALGGQNDGFVSIINPNYGSMAASTYIGTASTDQAVSVQVDKKDNVYVLGRTTGNYPILSGPAGPVWSGNTTGDIFIDNLDPELTRSIQSTRIGNAQNSFQRFFPSAFLVDICRNVYVAGYYADAGLPLSPDALQTGNAAFWFGVLQPDFAGLLYGSYFGVPNDHGHCGVSRMDPNGIVYHSICCSSGTYPGTAGKYAPNKNPGISQDIVSFKFNFEATGVKSDFELGPNQNDTGCIPYTVVFNNTSIAATSYVWDFGDGTTSTVTNPTHTFTDSGTYKVSLHAINPRTCITDDTSYFTIVVLKTAMPDIVVKDTVLCAFEQNIELHVDINNPSVNNTIKWGPPTGVISGGNQQTVTVDPTMNSAYYVTVKDTIPGICGFSKSDTIHIDLAPRILSLLTPDTAVCQGALVRIRATGTPAYTYTWSPGTGVSDSSILEPTITVNQSNIYTLTGTYHSCPDTTVTLSIEMQSIPDLTVTTDFAVCQWTDVALESSVTPYRPDYSYLWTPTTPDLSTPSGPNTHFIADSSITYSLHVKTPIGCSDDDSVTVTVFPGGFGSITADTGYCPGSNNYASLVAGGGNTYLWTPTDGLSSSTIPNPMASPHSSTDYTVYITDMHDCTDTERVTVRVYPMPLLSMPDSINLYSGEQYHLEPNTNASYFSWFPPSGISDVNIADPLLSPQVRTRYFATARTAEGCMIVDSIDVIVKETVIDMPNAFAPHGANNIFKPSKRGIVSLKDFSIYDRWGNKVYSSSNIDNGWDGNYNGKPQPMGVYVYTISAVTDSGHEFVQKGNITLIR